ncbi:hypothetical protein [Candidatus Methylacidiphilum infernorum]|nr:hypothetical protein [Candidatus Methylacidiphilum infernorum]
MNSSLKLTNFIGDLAHSVLIPTLLACEKELPGIGFKRERKRPPERNR